MIFVDFKQRNFSTQVSITKIMYSGKYTFIDCKHSDECRNNILNNGKKKSFLSTLPCMLIGDLFSSTRISQNSHLNRVFWQKFQIYPSLSFCIIRVT